MRAVELQVGGARVVAKARTRSQGVIGAAANWWWKGWQNFVAASGGRADDLVGPSPWRTVVTRGEGDDAE